MKSNYMIEALQRNKESLLEQIRGYQEVLRLNPADDQVRAKYEKAYQDLKINGDNLERLLKKQK